MANRWRKSFVNEPEYLEHLARVTTVAEVQKLYGIKHHTSILALIHRGDICAVQIQGTWVLSLDSVIAWYGEPDINNIA